MDEPPSIKPYKLFSTGFLLVFTMSYRFWYNKLTVYVQPYLQLYTGTCLFHHEPQLYDQPWENVERVTKSYNSLVTDLLSSSTFSVNDRQQMVLF